MFTRLVRFAFAPGNETKAQALADELNPLIAGNQVARPLPSLEITAVVSTESTFCGTPRNMRTRLPE